MVLHNNYQAYELHNNENRRFLVAPKFINFGDESNTHSCDICCEVVTNPLCPFCLAEEVKAWLTLYPHLKEDILSSLNAYLVNVNNDITNYGTICIKCHEDKASVCPYCFTEFVFKKLVEIQAGTIVLREFFEFFNFDLDHKGYTEFAEEIGVA